LPFSNQRLQIRFEACTILARVLEDQLDQAALAGPEVPMDATARQAMQDRYRLLCEELFEFVGCHFFLVKRET
jgi:hypothetical protein